MENFEINLGVAEHPQERASVEWRGGFAIGKDAHLHARDHDVAPLLAHRADSSIGISVCTGTGRLRPAIRQSPSIQLIASPEHWSFLRPQPQAQRRVLRLFSRLIIV